MIGIANLRQQPERRRQARRSVVITATITAAILAAAIGAATTPTSALEFQRISGEGSSWAANAIDAMRVNVRQFGVTVDYNPSGSTAGRKNFLNGTVDFAASDIPFQTNPEDGSAPENPAPGSYAYIPVTAGGTSFMYNLKINGQRVTNLRLSGENVVKIFTGVINKWNDPAIQADNPGLTMPDRAVVPVVRSDGSGSTAQLTKWMIARHPDLWNAYCARAGLAGTCGFTSFYPTAVDGMIAQSGDLGVSGYVSQGFAEGAIGYVNYSYALGAQFPVAKVLNAAGFYTEPTPQNVAVSLLKAQINTNEADPAVYLTQQLDGVYSDTDPRNYPLSSYSYLILPTRTGGQFNEAKGKTLAFFAYYAMCEAQQQSASLGYSPMPVNLVEASFDQIRKIPGAEVQNIDIRSCNNPTFSTDGSNVLATNAPQPKECDRQGPSMCPDGTGGLANVPTAVSNPGGDGSGDGGGSNGGSSGGSGDGSGDGSTGGSGGGTGGGGTSGGGGITGSSVPVVGSSSTVPTSTQTGGVGGGDGTETLAEEFCDPDTGLCASSAGADQGGSEPNGGDGQVAIGGVVTTTLSSSNSKIGAPLVLLVMALAVALFVVPAFAWRSFGTTPGQNPVSRHAGRGETVRSSR